MDLLVFFLHHISKAVADYSKLYIVVLLLNIITYTH